MESNPHHVFLTRISKKTNTDMKHQACRELTINLKTRQPDPWDVFIMNFCEHICLAPRKWHWRALCRTHLARVVATCLLFLFVVVLVEV